MTKQPIYREVSIRDIRPDPNQPRKISFDKPLSDDNTSSLASMAQSIKQLGVLSAVCVVEEAPGKYRIVFGERRWRAAKLAGLETLWVQIVPDDSAILITQLVENVQRADLEDTEIGLSILRLEEELKYPRIEIAKQMGLSPSSMTRYTSVLQEKWKPYLPCINNSGALLDSFKTISPKVRDLLFMRHNIKGEPYTRTVLVRIRALEKEAAERGIEDFVTSQNLDGVINGTVTEKDLPAGDPERTPYRHTQASVVPSASGASAVPPAVGMGTHAQAGRPVATVAPAAASVSMHEADKLESVELPRDLMSFNAFPGLVPSVPKAAKEEGARESEDDVTIRLSSNEAKDVLIKLGVWELPGSAVELEGALLKALRSL